MVEVLVVDFTARLVGWRLLFDPCGIFQRLIFQHIRNFGIQFVGGGINPFKIPAVDCSLGGGRVYPFEESFLAQPAIEG